MKYDGRRCVPASRWGCAMTEYRYRKRPSTPRSLLTDGGGVTLASDEELDTLDDPMAEAEGERPMRTPYWYEWPDGRRCVAYGYRDDDGIEQCEIDGCSMPLDCRDGVLLERIPDAEELAGELATMLEDE